jgi:hypothetical protein
MAARRSGVVALGALALAASVLAGCETADEDRGGDGGRRGEGDVIGQVLGDILGGGASGGGGGLGDILGGGGGGSAGGGVLGGVLGRRGGSVTYRCEDDLGFTASFDAGGRGATVETRRRTYELRLEDEEEDEDRGRRGYRSADGDVRLELDGRRADLSVEGDKDFRDCEPL